MSQALRTRSTLLGTSLALAALSFATGCSAVHARPASALSVEREDAEFVVDGRGRVSGGMIECGPDADGVCSARFDDLGRTTIVPEAEKGWRFAGWDRTPKNGSVAPDGAGSGEVVYTARFVPETIASSDACPTKDR